MQRFLLAALVCTATAAFAQDIQFDYDRTANFSMYRTYQWVERPMAAAGNQLMDQNIKRAIDQQLAGKGLRRVESGGDLQVSYQAAIEHEKQFDGWGSGPRWQGSGRVTTTTIEIGKIVIDFRDAAKNQLVWRGAAAKTLDIKKDPDKNYKSLENAMAKLFKNYPPASNH